MKVSSRSTEVHSRLIDHASIAAAIFDHSLRCVACNQYWRHTFGLSSTEPFKLQFNDFFPDKDTSLISDLQRAATGEFLAGKHAYTLQTDGGVRQLVLDIHPWNSSKSSDSEILVVASDIAASLSTSLANEDMMFQMEKALSFGGIGIWVYDLESGKMNYSTIWKTLTGYNNGIIDDEYAGWCSLIHPEDFQEVVEGIEQVASGENTELIMEFRTRHRDGTYRWQKSLISAMPKHDGKPSRIMGCRIDISPLKKMYRDLEKSTRRFELLFEKSPYAISLTNSPNSQIIHVNQAWVNMFGFSREEALGRTSLELGIHRDKNFQERSVNSIRQGQILDQVEKTLFTKSGQPVQALIRIEQLSIDGEEFVICSSLNITEQRQAEARLQTAYHELKKSRERYAYLYDYAPVAYLTIDSNGQIIEANHTAAAILQQEHHQLIGKSIYAFVSPGDKKNLVFHGRQLIKSGEHQSFDLQMHKKDGSPFHALVVTAFEISGNGRQGGYLAMISDVSARKEEELRLLTQLKNRYQAIVMDQNELICRFDPQGRLTFVNDAFCRSFNVKYEDILRTNFLPHIHEDDSERVRRQLHDLTPVNPERTIEYRVYLSDGRIHWQQWCSRALFNNTGEIDEYQAVGRDITLIKEAEKRLQDELDLRQLLLDTLPCPALLIQHSTYIIQAANKEASAQGAVVGKSCYESWRMQEQPCAWCCASQLTPEEKPVSRQLWIHDRYCDFRWIPIRGEKCFLLYCFDITEVQRNKEELEKTRLMLEERVKERTQQLQESHAQLLHSEKLSAVGSLSASIAHEFNNPLQSVMTVLQGLRAYTDFGSREDNLVELAVQECRRMKSLIADLRDFYRPSQGKLVSLDINELLESLLVFLKKEYISRNIFEIRRLSKNLPQIRGVPDQLKQVFINLLNNAAEAMTSGGELSVTTEHIGTEVAVHIRDSGTGINPKDLPHIFEPFFTTKNALKGTGLGLSVSYGIIKKHGGRITVKSEVGKGSNFSIFLPMEGESKDGDTIDSPR